MKVAAIGVPRCGDGVVMVPPVGLEPTHLAPEASALSAELRGRIVDNIAVGGDYNNQANGDFTPILTFPHQGGRDL